MYIYSQQAPLSEVNDTSPCTCKRYHDYCYDYFEKKYGQWLRLRKFVINCNRLPSEVAIVQCCSRTLHKQGLDEIHSTKQTGREMTEHTSRSSGWGMVEVLEVRLSPAGRKGNERTLIPQHAEARERGNSFSAAPRPQKRETLAFYPCSGGMCKFPSSCDIWVSQGAGPE